MRLLLTFYHLQCEQASCPITRIIQSRKLVPCQSLEAGLPKPVLAVLRFLPHSGSQEEVWALELVRDWVLASESERVVVSIHRLLRHPRRYELDYSRRGGG